MPVAEFKNGQYLEPGDIILSTRLESLFSFLMKRLDHSRFRMRASPSSRRVTMPVSIRAI